MKDGLRSSVNFLKMTAREYEASVNALNIFFGAVIGLSIGSVEEISTREYVELLLVTSGLVISILFVTYSDRKLSSVLTAILLFGTVCLVHYIDETKLDLPPKLLPTLGVWIVLAMSTELLKVRNPL